MPSTTTTRRCSLHTTTTDSTPRVQAIAGPRPVVAVNLGPGADLYLDVETANELAEALAAAVLELDAAAEAVPA